jgi:hypothetical protein
MFFDFFFGIVFRSCIIHIRVKSLNTVIAVDLVVTFMSRLTVVVAVGPPVDLQHLPIQSDLRWWQ